MVEKGRRPENEEAKKIFCEIVEGVVYSDRCLYKLSKVIEGNKSCEDCILRKFEKIESCGTKEIHTSLEKKKRGRPKGPRRTAKKAHSARLRKIPKEETGSAKDAPHISKQTYSTQDLIGFLKKSERRIREWAQGGKIPAHKVGSRWRFSKEEIDRWLSERESYTSGSTQEKKQQESAMPQEEVELSAGVPGDSSSKVRE